MMLGEVVHYVGIPKHREYYNAWHTEYIVNIEDKDLITTRQFRKIMVEMHMCHTGDPFYFKDIEGLHMTTFDHDNKLVDKFVRHKCCWREDQYAIDEIYKGTIDSVTGLEKYVFVTLKQIIYLEEKSPHVGEWSRLRIEKFKPIKNVIAKEIPEHPSFPGSNELFNIIIEGTPEFDDKYIVVRKYKEW